MADKKKVYVYFDGSNFYHNIKNNYGITSIKFDDICNRMLELSREELVKIRYFNCPVNQQEDPQKYADQLRFFENLRKTPFVEISLGKLARRQLKKININCTQCGHQKAEYLVCPKCKNNISVSTCYKSWEKGVDVKLAINMLLDGLNNKYDVALLFSGDADFCPAVRYIVKQLNKEVVYCHFPSPKTNELMQTCSGKRLITRDIVLKSMPNRF